MKKTAISFMLVGCFSLPAIANHGEPIQAIPKTLELHQGKVELGRKLFHDKQLSADNSVACASCHSISKRGVDGLSRSVGIGGKLGGIKSPSVFHSSYNVKQFWDGRAKDLEEQVSGPTQNPIEMGSNWPQILTKLKASADYQKLFKQVYGGIITEESVSDAIATYERSLITPNSRFDQYLDGEKSALTPEEKKGYELFKSKGCIACHHGPAVGGTMFQKMGIFGDYFKDRDGQLTAADMGVYNISHNESDKHVFKVPSLRNAVLTPPYFHDGSVKTIQQAVDKMARYQLGMKLTKEEVDLIVEFLYTLPGEYELKGEELTFGQDPNAS